jgi:hypothetical protein
VRRFEYLRAALPDRPGLNPFTRKPLVIKAMPARLSFVEIAVGATSVTVRWGECYADTLKPLAEVQEDIKTFDNEAGAAAFEAESVASLLADGFVEVERRILGSASK